MEPLYKAIHKPCLNRFFLDIANLILNDEAYIMTGLIFKKANHRHLFFIGLSGLKNQTQKALEELEKVLKISPSFLEIMIV